MNLPIGIQDFNKLRQGGYLYIDKTESIFRLAKGGGYFFLSRPRRFGKSLLVSTLADLYKGKKELFDGLWIENQWDWSKRHPVIELRFNNASYKLSGLAPYLSKQLIDQANQYGITLTEEFYPDQFRELILALKEKAGKVVILIDEYDKPIIDFLDDMSQAKINRDTLKNFYSVIKPLDAHLEFVFLTGVSKFSRVSIFSDLNHLNDITMDPMYATLCGYTQAELEHHFGQAVKKLAQDNNKSKEEQLFAIKDWYNGYSWDGKNFLYNPFSILNYFSKGVFQNFWFTTGTPTFLVNVLRKNDSYNFEEVETGIEAFDNFQLDFINPLTLLFQTGYVTIKKYELEDELYTLSYPNKEVRDSLLKYLLASYAVNHAGNMHPIIIHLKRAFLAGDLEKVMNLFNSLFAQIPHEIFIAKKEAYYHTVLFLALQLLNYHIQSEISHHIGRLDAVLHTTECIYILEFKLDQSADIAIQQIKDRQYAQAYLNQGKAIKAIGINFDSATKQVADWKVEELT